MIAPPPQGRPPTADPSPSGFTLAEVLFAMAIFSFAVLMMIGSLPNGLASMRDARQQAAEARSIVHLSALYQAELDRSTPATFTSIIAPLLQPAYFYFDANGDPVRGGSSQQADTVFGVRAELLPAVELPGESDPSPFIRRLELAISTDWQNANSYLIPRRHHRRVVPLALRTPLNLNAPTQTNEGGETPPTTDAP